MNVIENKYYRWYNELMESRSKLDRIKSKDIYYESHHKIPRSLGGSNSKDNLVLLMAREHFIAHLLLPKFLKGEERNKMVRARWYMSYIQKRYKKYGSCINSKIYEKYKIQFRKSISGENSPRYGIKVSKQTRKKLSKAASGEKSHWYGIGPMKGKYHSEETKAKMRKSRLGVVPGNKGMFHLEETKAKISKNISGEKNGMYGKKHSEESIQKMSKAQKGKNHKRFKGYYITPYGKFATSKEAETDLISAKAIQRYCKNSDKIITKAMFSKSEYFRSLNFNSIGKSLKEIGFFFEKV